jgi:hypothetical protein
MAMTAKPPNYTTTVAPEKTAAECVLALGHYGAAQVTLFFNPARLPVGITFTLDAGQGLRGYKLGVDFDRTLSALMKASLPRANTSRAQAQRTAWKTLQAWLETQLTLIETGLMSAEQVLLPYEVNTEGSSRWEVESERRSVTAGTVVDQ